ncbi:RagB/SusD family nutrient uptake outer membrane protein [Chitinophagaceae bacterium LB-8]|uniref:RagB/SusD family nutrient uptake outer membrane protein n=1 Tax=Paraflavisolibacter caeni TaxID=2982496 RepID=A0A9X2XVK8_9BACT|nr:RagB/SusD family nutrient uptake outer membrane protein [Paraflavisolibacter caeni]MCU7550159.1 RagB/SusD family nutrient uptake outer membrane protein [Paraflavisolibacter caeni]
MNPKIFKQLITVILALLGINACTDKLDVTDQNNPTTETYFKTAAELQNGVNAIYSSLRSAELVGREWFFLHDMRGGETAPGGPQLEAPRAELLLQTNGAPSNSVLTNVWNGAYQMINRANTVFSKAPGVNDNTSLRDILVGEAKFLRAWAYFELVTQWGDVPIYTEPVLSNTDYKAKSPAADIYALIIKDLTEAVQALPVSPSQPGRVTKGAANAVLGKVQMQKGDYAAAKEALLQVVNSGKYKLIDKFLQNFDGDVMSSGSKVADGHEFNEESVLEVAFVDKGDNNFNWAYNGEGISSPVSTVHNQEYGIVWGNVIPSNRLLDEFDDNDPRLKYTFYQPGDLILTFEGTKPGKALTAADMNVAASTRKGVTVKRVFRKYSIYDWDNNGFHPGGVNQRLIRYADVLLMLAESEIELGNLAKGAEYLNMVRARPSVNMPPLTLTSKNQAIRAIMKERAVELAIEGSNNIDILRWRKKGYFPSIMPDPRQGQQDLLPIPSSETAANPLLQ